MSCWPWPAADGASPSCDEYRALAVVAIRGIDGFVVRYTCDTVQLQPEACTPQPKVLVLPARRLARSQYSYEGEATTTRALSPLETPLGLVMAARGLGRGQKGFALHCLSFK